MKFDIKFNFKNTTKIDTKHIAEVASRVWQKMHMPLFFIVLIAAIIIGGYIWEQSIYSGGWSKEKKQEYLDTKNKEVIFQEKDFQKVFDDITLRKEKSAKAYQPVKDIFKPY